MCLAIPGEIVELLDEDGEPAALVDVLGVRRQVHLGLLEHEQLAPGDWILIHVGFAMSRIDAAEAAEVLAMLKEAAQAT